MKTILFLQRAFALLAVVSVLGCQSYEIRQTCIFSDDAGRVVSVDYCKAQKPHTSTFINPATGKEVDFKSIIVFSNRCTLKEITLKNQEIKVINRYRVVEIVAEILGGIEENCLDSENIKFLYEKIFPFTQVEESVKKQHIKNIQVASEDVNQKINENIETKKQTVSDTVGKVCPKCGNNMVLRTAQKGQHVGKQFWGCTNYPKCRYIQNIDGLSLRKKK